MSGLLPIAFSVIAGFVVLVTTFALGRASQFISRRTGLRYLRQWLVKDDVIIVLPNFSQYAGGHEFLLALPKNVQMMPAAEAAAVTDLIRSLEAANRKLRVHFTTDCYPENPNKTPVISVGGPSVNSVSADLLASDQKQFVIKYPEHIADVAGVKFEPRRDPSNQTIEDWGFLATGTVHGAPYIVVCGVFSQGTWAAVLTLTKLVDHKTRQSIAKREKLFLVSKARVDGFQVDGDAVTVIQPQPFEY